MPVAKIIVNIRNKKIIINIRYKNNGRLKDRARCDLTIDQWPSNQ